jgi:hypothetical protein
MKHRSKAKDDTTRNPTTPDGSSAPRRHVRAVVPLACRGLTSARRTVVDHAADASSAGRQPLDGDPWLAAEHAVELVRALFEAQVVALFGVAGERLILLASYGLTQGVLDSVAFSTGSAIPPRWARPRSRSS